MAHPSEAHLAPYAVRSSASGGWRHTEPADPLRTPFELDRHRIIESTAFRRLEGKTQVFAPSHHDHFRTRLTHTLEAAQIARCLSVGLRANELLAEAITLAHDLGHAPFGHAGEAALNEAMRASGGFNHNAHSLRVVEYLEHPFPAFRGLNLTAATRAGLMTHETRYDTPRPRDAPSAAMGEGGVTSADVVEDPELVPSVEAQIASMADRIAYNCHDLEDAIGAGLVGLDKLKGVALWRHAYETCAREFDDKHIHAIRRPVLDAILNALLADVIPTSHQRLDTVESYEQVRTATQPLLALSHDADTQVAELEHFLLNHAYKHPAVAAMDSKARGMVLELFEVYHSNPDALPPRFAARIDEQGCERVICDYLAGMTDRFCQAEHERLLAGRGAHM
jgi:dGTPase